MSKSLKIFLVILALISVILTIGIMLDWDFSFKKFKKISENMSLNRGAESLTPTPTPGIFFNISSEIKDSSEGLLLDLPVEKKYFENFKAPLIGGHIGSLYLAFFLDEGTEIKSIFNGQIALIQNIEKFEEPYKNNFDFSIIMIENEDKSFLASYGVVGNILVNQGEKVESGSVLAKAGQGGMNFRQEANFSLSLWQKVGEEYQTIGLTKEIFLKD